MRPPRGLDVVRLQVALQPGINHIGGKDQGHLPERHSSALRTFRGASTTTISSAVLRNSRGIVSSTPCLSAFLPPRAGRRCVVDLLIHDIDSVCQQLLYILPPMGISAPRAVVSQPVNHANLRV